MATEQRLISLDDLMKFPIRINHYDKEHGNKHFVLGIESVLEYAEQLPTIEARPVVHGRWVLAKPRVKGRNATYRCTACGKLRSSYYNDVFQWEYCPCGAKMDGGADT